MIDDLRTRIGKIVRCRRYHTPATPCGGDSCPFGGVPSESDFRLADAVIRELKPELNRHNTGCVCDDCWGDEHA